MERKHVQYMCWVSLCYWLDDARSHAIRVPSQYIGRLSRYGGSHIKDKMVARPPLIFNMEIPILVTRQLYIETTPPPPPPPPPGHTCYRLIDTKSLPGPLLNYHYHLVCQSRTHTERILLINTLCHFIVNISLCFSVAIKIVYQLTCVHDYLGGQVCVALSHFCRISKTHSAVSDSLIT